MKPLTSSQRKYLRGLAHNLNPGAIVGHRGVTQSLIQELEVALDGAELIKIKFVDHKDKPVKTDLTREILDATGAMMAGMIGHVVILYRPHRNPEKRRITLEGHP